MIALKRRSKPRKITIKTWKIFDNIYHANSDQQAIRHEPAKKIIT